MIAYFSSEIRKCLGAVGVVAVAVCFEPSAARFQGLTVAAVGMLWIAFPPSARLSSGWRGVVGALLVLPLLTLLPLGNWDVARWRTQLVLAGNTYPLLTPQPWEMLATFAGYVAAVVFAVWLFLAAWTERQRRWLAWGLGGVILVSISAIVWREGGDLIFPLRIETGLGPFPSRNQSGLFFALASLWWLFLGAESARRSRWISVVFCGVMAMACSALTVGNGSRAGVGFLIMGILLQCALGGWGMARAPRLLLAALLAGIASFAIFELRDLPAFQRGGGDNRSFRQAVQMDTLDLIGDSPVVGIGLGNYEAVFAFYRTRSASEYRVRHAENDWLHAAAETGIPATLLLAAIGIALLVQVAYHLRRDPSPRTVTIAIGLWLFAIHLLFDQSGHAPGIVFWLLVMVSLLFATSGTSPVSPLRGRWIGVGLMAMAIALVGWVAPREVLFVSAQGVNFQPGELPSLAELEEALVIRPLNGDLHEMRAHQLALVNRWDEVTAEFRMAKMLEPFSTALAQREIQVFRRSPYPARTAAAIDELVRRAPEATRAAFLDAYLKDAAKTPSEVEAGKWDFQVIRWRLLEDAELRQRLAELTRPPISLTPYTEVKLANMAIRIGGLEELERVAIRVGGFQATTWRAVAQALANAGDYRAADWIVIAHLLPAFSETVSFEQRLREWQVTPTDPAASFALARAYLQQGSLSAARRVIDGVPIRGEGGKMIELYRGWADYLDGNYQAAWKRLSIGFLPIKNNRDEN